jgi:hypothetical protein
MTAAARITRAAGKGTAAPGRSGLRDGGRAVYNLVANWIINSARDPAWNNGLLLVAV